MKCPECNAWTSVIETRMRSDGSRRRAYLCANEHRFTTVEQILQLKKGGIRPGNIRGARGRFSTATKTDTALSTKDSAHPNTNKPKK